jgi:hypothetical protein
METGAPLTIAAAAKPRPDRARPVAAIGSRRAPAPSRPEARQRGRPQWRSAGCCLCPRRIRGLAGRRCESSGPFSAGLPWSRARGRPAPASTGAVGRATARSSSIAASRRSPPTPASPASTAPSIAAAGSSPPRSDFEGHVRQFVVSMRALRLANPGIRHRDNVREEPEEMAFQYRWFLNAIDLHPEGGARSNVAASDSPRRRARPLGSIQDDLHRQSVSPNNELKTGSGPEWRMFAEGVDLFFTFDRLPRVKLMAML